MELHQVMALSSLATNANTETAINYAVLSVLQIKTSISSVEAKDSEVLLMNLHDALHSNFFINSLLINFLSFTEIIIMSYLGG